MTGRELTSTKYKTGNVISGWLEIEDPLPGKNPESVRVIHVWRVKGRNRGVLHLKSESAGYVHQGWPIHTCYWKVKQRAVFLGDEYVLWKIVPSPEKNIIGWVEIIPYDLLTQEQRKSLDPKLPLLHLNGSPENTPLELRHPPPKAPPPPTVKPPPPKPWTPQISQTTFLTAAGSLLTFSLLLIWYVFNDFRLLPRGHQG